MHYWWECKLMQSLWKTLWRFLKKLRMIIRSSNPTCEYLSEEMKTLIWKDICTSIYFWASKVMLVIKIMPANVGDIRGVGSIPGLGRSPGEGNGKPLQYSCLENPKDRGAWWAMVHGVAKSHTWLSNSFTFTRLQSAGYLCYTVSHIPEKGPGVSSASHACSWMLEFLLIRAQLLILQIKEDDMHDRL